MKKGLAGIYSADRLIGLIFFVLAVGGFFSTLRGGTPRGPGFGAGLFPQAAFALMGACGMLLVLLPARGEARRLLEWTELKSLLLLIGSGLLYFRAVLRLGLVVTTFLYVAGLFAVLTPNPVRHWKRIIIPALIATALIWAMFSTLIKIILPQTLLF